MVKPRVQKQCVCVGGWGGRKRKVGGGGVKALLDICLTFCATDTSVMFKLHVHQNPTEAY